MTWRPYLDLQIIQHSLYERGIPRYAAELSRALVKAGAPVAALALNARMPFPKRLPPELARMPELTWNTSAALRSAIEAGPTLYHVFAPFEGTFPMLPWLPLNVARNEVPLVVSVYDLIPEVMDYLVPGSRDERFYRVRSRMLAHADLLLAISDHTRRDVIDRLGVHEDRVCVVGAGCSDFFRPPLPGESPDAVVREHVPAIDRPYVLTVSAWDARKNTELLIDAFALLPRALRESLQLVVVCNVPPDWQLAWSDRARQRGLRNQDVVFTGFAPDPVLRALYQGTELFAYPSRYEGFGLPVVEAGRCGAPAVVSDAPGPREVVPWAPAQFDPDDADALAGLIERGVSDQSFRSRLLDLAEETAGRHTWEHVAQRTISAYERLDRPTRERRTRRARPSLRLAFVGPFPPARTGIAGYNAAVAAHLEDQCELECFVDAGDWSHEHVRGEAPTERVQSVGSRRPTGSQARWLPAGVLGRRIDPARYDAIVYALGNSWYHHETLTLARRFPGIAWVHDVDLTGLYITYAHRLLDRDPKEAAALFRDVLGRYGARAPAVPITESLDEWALYEPYRRAGIHFTLEVARDAAACLVTSEHARRVLEFDAGPSDHLPPVHVLPLAVPHRGRRREPDRGTPCVVSLGRQDFEAKQPELVLEAMALVLRTRQARLTLVGQIRPDQRAELVRRAEELDIGHAVEIAGYVGDDEYHRRVEEATCAIQLRRSLSTGEGSAAVNDAIAVGLPVITNISSCQELPAGTVELVSPDASPSDLAREILRVLDDHGHRNRLGDAAGAYRGTWSFDNMTAELLRIIDETRTKRWESQPKTA
jgi:glycosyltransferase involved in cell wall biosynthesis